MQAQREYGGDAFDAASTAFWPSRTAVCAFRAVLVERRLDAATTNTGLFFTGLIEVAVAILNCGEHFETEVFR